MQQFYQKQYFQLNNTYLVLMQLTLQFQRGKKNAAHFPLIYSFLRDAEKWVAVDGQAFETD